MKDYSPDDIKQYLPTFFGDIELTHQFADGPYDFLWITHRYYDTQVFCVVVNALTGAHLAFEVFNSRKIQCSHFRLYDLDVDNQLVYNNHYAFAMRVRAKAAPLEQLKYAHPVARWLRPIQSRIAIIPEPSEYFRDFDQIKYLP